MKTSLQALAITALVAGSAFGGALAQSSDVGVDLASIRARAADQSAEAEALAVTARDRAKAVTADASQSADAGKANGRRYAGAAPRPAQLRLRDHANVRRSRATAREATQRLDCKAQTKWIE